ncbi:hypothetical protein K438DRAFT_886870 [Mycena galopus ATCC 62051]|nr:hypothetical protein K438DRAFT_886870 [Mycena galopus ATCC 62051]
MKLIFFILVHCSLLSRASTLPPSLSASAGAVTVTDTGASSRASELLLASVGSSDNMSFAQSATTTSSPPITSPFPSSLPTDRGDPHHDLHPEPSHPAHKDHQTGQAISNTGIILLSAFMLGLFGGVATCAWNYWRTPRRPAPSLCTGLPKTSSGWRRFWAWPGRDYRDRLHRRIFRDRRGMRVRYLCL